MKIILTSVCLQLSIFVGFPLEAVVSSSQNSGLVRGRWMSLFLHKRVILSLPLGFRVCCHLSVECSYRL